MSKLLLLLKVDLIRTFSLDKLKTNKNIYKKIGIVIIALFILTSLLSQVGMYTYMGTKFFMTYGIEKYILPLVYFLCGFTIFYSTVYRSKSYLFGCEDNIFAMPIKPSVILTSKVVVLTILSYIVTTIIFVPAFITYGFMLKLGIAYYIYAFLAYLFLPFLPTILGCIFGYIIGYITSKVNNKKIFETIFTYVTVLLIMYVSFNVQTLAMKFVNNIELVNKLLSNVGFLINSFMAMISEYSFKDLLIYVFTNIISMVAFIAIFKSSYVKILQNLKVENTKKKYIEKEHKNKSPLATLVAKELKMYFSIPIYILNTSFGVVLMFFASIATLFYDKAALLKMMEIDITSLPVYLVVIAVIAFTIPLSNTSACSISIEGKNFWILKTMPIKIKDIFLSKIILNMLIVLPLMIIDIIIFAISFKLTIMQVLTAIVFTIILNVACSIFGVIINLKFPRLDFVSYTHVVKQSFSVFLGIFVPLILCLALGGLYFALKMSIDTYILLVFALLCAIIVLQYNILKSWGIKRFNELN
jgi:ABC-2 type transport system permease protein